MKKIMISLSCAVTTFLSGCSSFDQENFDCPPVAGVGCMSIPQVNKMIDEGKIKTHDERDTPTSPENKLVSSHKKNLGFVWVAPYRRTSKTWQGPQMIHVALPDDKDVEQLYRVRPLAPPADASEEIGPISLAEKKEHCPSCVSGDTL